MLTTAKSVHNRRKIEMVVLRLSILAVRKLICSMSVRNMDSKNDDDRWLLQLLIFIIARKVSVLVLFVLRKFYPLKNLRHGFKERIMVC